MFLFHVQKDFLKIFRKKFIIIFGRNSTIENRVRWRRFRFFKDEKAALQDCNRREKTNIRLLDNDNWNKVRQGFQ